MGKRLFLGIDVGSASVRAGLDDATGARLAFAARAIDQFHPRPLFVEPCSADRVRPGGSHPANPQTKAFHDAECAIHLPLYEDMERCRSAMRA